MSVDAEINVSTAGRTFCGSAHLLLRIQLEAGVLATRSSGKLHRVCFGNESGPASPRTGKSIDSRDCRMPNKKLIAEWIATYGEDSEVPVTSRRFGSQEGPRRYRRKPKPGTGA